MNIVWFKRDLRLADHEPLRRALQEGPVLALYVYEPSVMGAEDFSFRHLTFINESLIELAEALRERGGQLVTRVGELPEVLAELHARQPLTALWAHEESGNGLTFERDRAVIRWCADHGVPFHEIPQFGVVRRLKSRDGWASHWAQFMRRPPLPTPDAVPPVTGFDSAGILERPPFVTRGLELRNEQYGGTKAGREALRSFLTRRGRDYRRGMSSPNSAWDACSRLSPYLAWGNLSMREVVHAAQSRRAGLMPQDTAWRESIDAFLSRLSWHCHFIQKLEDEPRIEFENMHRGYDGLREDAFDEERFAAWCDGQTGYPLIDACMRAVRETGWLNFRMRAMVVSFASYHLWLHWRRPALHLARLFTDYEPGIHYSQFQMQSGTTGINTVRIYSPPKQVADQDPEGTFIRRWVPELAEVPDAFIAEPHTMGPLHQQAIDVVIGRDYPAPIVDHGTAYREARARIDRVRKRDGVRAEARSVVQRHGSRKRPTRPPGRRF